MDKHAVARLGVLIGSKELGLSDIEIEFKDESFFPSKEVNAMFIPKTYTIVFNTDWFTVANELEILKCAFHEIRHAYQMACIEFPASMNIDVPLSTVKKWKKEFETYSNPKSDKYLDQEIERDAINFSNKFLNKII